MQVLCPLHVCHFSYIYHDLGAFLMISSWSLCKGNYKPWIVILRSFSMESSWRSLRFPSPALTFAAILYPIRACVYTRYSEVTSTLEDMSSVSWIFCIDSLKSCSQVTLPYPAVTSLLMLYLSRIFPKHSTGFSEKS